MHLPHFSLILFLLLLGACNKEQAPTVQNEITTEVQEILYQIENVYVTEPEFFSSVTQKPKLEIRDKELALEELAKTHELLIEVAKKVNGKEKIVISAFKTKKERDIYE